MRSASSPCLSAGSSPLVLHEATAGRGFYWAKTEWLPVVETVMSETRWAADWRRENITDCPWSDVTMREVSFGWLTFPSENEQFMVNLRNLNYFLNNSVYLWFHLKHLALSLRGEFSFFQNVLENIQLSWAKLDTCIKMRLVLSGSWWVFIWVGLQALRASADTLTMLLSSLVHKAYTPTIEDGFIYWTTDSEKQTHSI